MKKQTHHIQKQKVELDFETEEKARYWNNRFADFYYSDLLPRLSTLLDSMIPEHHSYVIDRLEIDVGTVDMDEFRTAFLKEMEGELKRLFKSRSIPGSTKKDRTSQDEKQVRQDHRVPGQKGQRPPTKQEENIRIKDREEHLLETFYHFLDYGILPWYSKWETIAGLEEDIRQEWELEKLCRLPGFQKCMHALPVRRRLWFQFSNSFAEGILNRYYKDERADLATLQKDLERSLIPLAKEASSPDKIRQELSKNIWPRIIEAGPAGSPDWLQHFIWLSTENAASHLKYSRQLSIVKAILEELPPSSPLLTPLKKLLTSKEISTEPEKPEPTRDKPGADPADQGDSATKSPTAGKETEDNESTQKPADDSVQKSSDDTKRTDEEVKAEISSGKHPKQTDEAAGDLQKNKSSSEIKPSEAAETEDETPLPGSDESKGEPSERQVGRQDQKHTACGKESGVDKGGDSAADAVQKSSKEYEADEEIGTAHSSGESKKQLGKNAEELRKDNRSDKEYSETPESEDRSSRPVSDVLKAKSSEKEKPLRQPGDEASTDLPKSDAADDRQTELREALEEYYLRDAGIVLCWPYLERLFVRLEYLEDNGFKSPRYHKRAVHLLGYIASGEEQREEHALVLAKFLCTWPLQMPIIKELELTKNEKNSADQMLKSLINHWSVLKNTSVEGLRQSFLRREGKLFKVEKKEWRLIVEQKSYDMLLDHKPYSIAIIKLPWMKSILKVDWA